MYLNTVLSVLDATGKVWPEIYNRGGNAQYKYFYSDATQSKLKVLYWNT